MLKSTLTKPPPSSPFATSFSMADKPLLGFSLVCTYLHLVKLDALDCKLLYFVVIALGSTLMQVVALGCTLLHFGALGCTWLHLVACGCTWLHLAALGCPWWHFGALGGTQMIFF